MRGTLTIKQAMEETGASLDFIKRHCQRGTFLAAKPLGRTGGWRIFEEPFRRWWSDQIGRTSNRPAAAAKQQGVKI